MPSNTRVRRKGAAHPVPQIHAWAGGKPRLRNTEVRGQEN